MGNQLDQDKLDALRTITLQDKYEQEEGVAYMSGIQALARLPIIQRRRDIAAGLNTAGFISGYRGSPLAGYDRELMRAGKYLKQYNVKFVPGVNEDLAATSIWGTQQVNLYPGGKHDGVFGIWYGKAPGVDRSGDVFRHANAAGTSPHGGVLALAGDDHACKSSSLPAQSDHSFYATMIPMLYPSSIQEFVEYGLLGIEMSRYSGCWTAFKVTSDTAETSGTIDLSRENRLILHPDESEFEMPPGGVHIRMSDIPREMDWRLQNYKLFACHAFCRKNNIDRVVLDSPKPRFGIITSGKSYGDVRQALVELGITDDIAKEIGLRLYKVGMPWPLEPQGVQEFCEGLEEILIVEEKREFIENQLKQQIFNWHADKRPVVVGKYDESHQRLLPLENEQSVGLVCRIIAQRLSRFYKSEAIDNCLRFYEERDKKDSEYKPANVRTPFYCAGCPHNTSTKVIEGSHAFAGIGCHYMSQWMDRDTGLYTHMGAEGVPWIGHAPFTENKHVFTNLGDGTYFHSGVLAIRASVAAKVNITYKILYNDAVAMTGGQDVDGELSVASMAQQVVAEGVSKAWIVTDNPSLYDGMGGIPAGVDIVHRDKMELIQKQARDTEGCSVIIYEQTCAAEKRRRRKRGLMDDPAKRVFINDAVCEGCGDCSEQSNCIAVLPLETEYGRKRQINQSACNKDFSCLKGFCPSFVTIHGGNVRKDKASVDVESLFCEIPMPKTPEIDGSYNVLIAGVGGTGVLTIGAMLGMAAHMEGKHCAILDMTGLAQKGGSVLSHIRLSHSLDTLRTGHIISGGTDLLMAYDIVAASGHDAYDTLSPERTKLVVNSDYTPVSEFVINNDVNLHDKELIENLSENTQGDPHFIHASSITRSLMGDEMPTNVFMLGYAWQQGLIPIGLEALQEVIRLNGIAVEMNKQAFAYGRLAAHDLGKLEALIKDLPSYEAPKQVAQTLNERIETRAEYLLNYQNEAYAQRYFDFMARVSELDNILQVGEDLSEAAALGYHKVLAYKDEYEVARLYTDGAFLKKLKKQFSGNYKIEFHMAPPIFERIDEATGRPKKKAYGPWMMRALSVLAKLKFLRGTRLDVFRYHEDRKEERKLIEEYEYFLDVIEQNINADNYKLCVELLSSVMDIKGFGPVKAEGIKKARALQTLLVRRIQHLGNAGGSDAADKKEAA